MDFRIETSKPTEASALQESLEKARDAWLEKTPQVHPEGSPEHKALQDTFDAIDNARLEGPPRNGPQYPNHLSKAVDAQAALVKAQSAKPTPDMAGALNLINEGIQSAVSTAKTFGSPVRASIFGHFNNIVPQAVHGGYMRLCVTVDDAKLG